MPVEGACHETGLAAAANRRFYDALWSASYLVPPQRFNTWPLLSALADAARTRLEIGPGLRPRLSIPGTYFVDLSLPALSRLKACGGLATPGEITALPFPDCSFDLVCAFDVVEHVENDRLVFHELSRVARDDATVIFSVPLHAGRWSAFDALVGHVRRYDPDDLLGILAEHSFVLEQSAAFGMEPRSRWLLDFAVWGLTQRRVQALRWYNRLFLPLGLLLQSRLAWGPGLIDLTNVSELLLVCRRPRRPRCLVRRSVLSSVASGRRFRVRWPKDDLLERAAARFDDAHPRFKWYARMKYRMDPCYRAVARRVPPDTFTVDLGTGLGMLPIVLGLMGAGRRVLGVEWDAEKARAGARAAAGVGGVEIVEGDAQAFALPECDIVTIVDVLHYYDAGFQRALIARCSSALRPGGRLLIRDGDGERRGGARWTRFVEGVVTRFGWNRGPMVRFRPVREIVADLEQLGFRVRVHQAAGRLHPGNVLLVAERPKAQGD